MSLALISVHLSRSYFDVVARASVYVEANLSFSFWDIRFPNYYYNRRINFGITCERTPFALVFYLVYPKDC